MTISSSDKAKGRVLLPSTIIPSRYDLVITPDLEKYTFEGEVKIALTTSQACNTNEITLHAKELCFISANFVVGEANPVEAQEFRVGLKVTTATLVFGEKLPADSSDVILNIRYTGFLNNQMAGFYRSSYTDIHGKSKIMASTQFESLDARRAFPCWDEPARKAIFGLSLVIPSNLDCLSNMPTKSCHSFDNGTKKVEFLDSPKMSTYLLAFLVGEFDHLQAQTKNGVLVKVHTPPGKVDSGQFALDCAVKALDAYDDFFGVPYPLPKLDMIAIPEFAAGAMENWGLVTYREVDLLIDPVKASSMQKQRVCTVVTHELAHQWFGNLVTMAWWDDLWLNEGFASWAENWAGGVLYPDYCFWDQFTTGHLSAALRLDALKSSHPIQVPIHHAEEVEQVFDAISYCKGGSVVRMIEAVLGFPKFREGLANYMQKHKYSNTETYDLWKAWEDSSGMPVGELMASWTEQMGFPVLEVVGENWEADKVTLDLKQSWFLSDGSELSEEEQKKIWTIPIITCTEEGTQSDMIMLREKTATITVPTTSWVKLNAGQQVPMRVQLTPEMIKHLSAGIKSKTLPPCDRAGVLTDSYALVKAGRMSPESLMLLLSSYKNEDSYIVWQGLSDVLGGLETVMSDDEKMSANFKTFAKVFLLHLMESVGWEKTDSDGHLTTLLRGMMIGLLSTFCHDDPAVVAEARARFQAFLEDANDVESLPSDMRTPVFKIILKNGGEKEYSQVLAYFDTATDNAERKHVLGSLGSAADPSLKIRTMEWSTSGAIKLQDFFYPMGSVGRSSREGREISWQYFKDNFDKISAMVGKGSSSLMDACIVSCVGGFCSTEKADDIEAFFAEHPLPRSARKISQTTENIRTNAKFLDMLKASDLGSDSFWESL
jgi:puromycin-sensitive aminopeptidase